MRIEGDIDRVRIDWLTGEVGLLLPLPGATVSECRITGVEVDMSTRTVCFNVDCGNCTDVMISYDLVTWHVEAAAQKNVGRVCVTPRDDGGPQYFRVQPCSESIPAPLPQPVPPPETD